LYEYNTFYVFNPADPKARISKTTGKRIKHHFIVRLYEEYLAQNDIENIKRLIFECPHAFPEFENVPQEAIDYHELISI
jgi:hypothetical protein